MSAPLICCTSSRPTHCLTDWRPSILLPVSLLAAGHTGESAAFKARVFCCYLWVFFLSFLLFLSHKLPPPLLSRPPSDDTGLPTHCCRFAPIPLHSCLIPGLIIPRLWQSSAASSPSGESTRSGPRASSLCPQQTQCIHHSRLGRPLCMAYLTGVWRSPPWEESEKRVYFCQMPDTYAAICSLICCFYGEARSLFFQDSSFFAFLSRSYLRP